MSQQYLGVSAVLLGVGGETLDRVSFRVAERTLGNGDAVRMDHPAVPSQIWWTKQQVLLIHSLIHLFSTSAIKTVPDVPVMRIS